MPTAGKIFSSVTYTLTADCTQTGVIGAGGASEITRIIVTVNGGGFTIKGAADQVVFKVNNQASLVLNNVTVDGGGPLGDGAISINNSQHASSITNVTLRNTKHTAIRFDDQRENSPSTTHTLSNVLIEDANPTGSYYYSADHGIPAGIHTIGNENLNINNLVLRGVLNGNSGIGANDSYIGGSNAMKGTITLTGCFTADGVFPRVWYGDIVDNSTEPCSGSIGNGGSSAIKYPQAPVSPCGLPLGGFIYGKHIYNLKGDCVLSQNLFIPYESGVVIHGNGNEISGGRIVIAGTSSLSNFVMSGYRDFHILTYLNTEVTIKNAIFRDNVQPLAFLDNIVTLEKVLIENHSQTRQRPSAIFVVNSTQLTIRDSVFRGNTGGIGALYAGAPYQYGVNPSTTLEGCITFENNDPADIYDPNSLLTDNRRRPCPPDMTFLVKPSPPDTKPDTSKGSSVYIPPPPSELCDGKPKAVPVGSVACIFRHEGVLSVWGIDAQSQGFFMVAATSAQIDATCAGMVAASPDGRAAIFVSENRDVIVSVGPDYEGKVLHVRLDGGMYGRALAIATTYGPPPGLGIPASQPEACARALHGCMVRTNNIVNFRDAPNGSLLRFVDIWGIYNDGMLPYDVTLTALERTQDWFKVDYHGTQGWISAHYVEAIGACG